MPEQVGDIRAQDFLDFLATQPGFEDLIKRGLSRSQIFDFRSEQLAQPGETAALQLGGGLGAQSSALGLGRLNELLLRGGRTDPAFFNRQIAQAERGTQARQRAVEGEFARRNLGGAGALPALQAAIGQSGEGRIAEIGERETQLSQDRLLQALDRFGSLVQAPAIDLTAIGTGQFNAAAGRSQQQKGAILDFLGSILGGALSGRRGGD